MSPRPIGIFKCANAKLTPPVDQTGLETFWSHELEFPVQVPILASVNQPLVIPVPMEPAERSLGSDTGVIDHVALEFNARLLVSGPRLRFSNSCSLTETRQQRLNPVLDQNRLRTVWVHSPGVCRGSEGPTQFGILATLAEVVPLLFHQYLLIIL